ncbi:MAG: hypothetical protein K2X35_09270 [Bryobacteraceae bacterium]|nr:hypothetical protein [Bryobacteraceae bacterium]
MPNAFSSRDVGSAFLRCPRPDQPKPHWIEIQLIGEDGKPLPWEEYRVELPDGKVVKGFLDENGTARIEHISTPGSCKVSFEDLDQEAWETVQG